MSNLDQAEKYRRQAASLAAEAISTIDRRYWHDGNGGLYLPAFGGERTYLGLVTCTVDQSDNIILTFQCTSEIEAEIKANLVQLQSQMPANVSLCVNTWR